MGKLNFEQVSMYSIKLKINNLPALRERKEHTVQLPREESDGKVTYSTPDPEPKTLNPNPKTLSPKP